MKFLTTKKSWTALGLAGALGLGTLGTNALVSQAQPDPNAVPKTENPNNRQNRQNRQKRQRVTPEQRLKATQDQEIATIEQTIGKTLTDAQKEEVRTASVARQEAVKVAQDKYLQDLSKTTGLEVDELKLKMRDARGKRVRDAVNGMNDRRQDRQNRPNRRNQKNGAAQNGAA